MTDHPTLTTERLTLTPPTPADLPCYAAFYEESDVTVGGYRGGRSDAEVAAIHARDMAHWRDHGHGMFLIRLREADRFVGGAGIIYPEGWSCHELTWFLRPDARGAGVATEASLAVIAWACRDLGWAAVETLMRDENVAAHRLAQRLGGRVDRRETFPDGVARDVYVLPCPEAAA
ncbi:N-acetyltransferase [Rhodobacteraceae bacterium CCMM004]|nr:N-acetyltransferase [Rhodobacteraceae bacterium CCMM004]